ncbi:MAG TPA: amino acid adenylation domain-containing protein [Burkholderiaceae bacterium]|nr:amino acid adenylation domain-containing protein [Burkholderiaceae bacterium]
MKSLEDCALLERPAPCDEPGTTRPVHEWFERQVRRTPEAPALATAGGETVSYRMLNECANRLASRLRWAGVGSNTLVALCMDQGRPLVASMLAVLKAGGAYVPIDPNNPDARIRHILQDTSARLLLTMSSLAGRLADMGPELVCVDDPAIAVSGAADDLHVAVQMDQSVYCIYTSGSTGRPKGALNLHRGLSNLVAWYIGEAGLSATDRVMLASSIGFDLTQKNVIAPLCIGACVLLPQCSPADAPRFLKALSTMAPTWINCAPSTFRTFATSPRTKTLRTVVLGCETVDEALVSILKGRDLRLINSYGPTECSDVALWEQWSMNGAVPAGNMPIGRPIAQVRSLLLDSALKPVPPGEAGEICIGGVGVGRGYLGQPDKTADRFVVDPSDPDQGLIYRTGDLGRLRADGSVEFIGRQDFQVKVRGHRIELGEIESRLLENPGVAAAAVCALEAARGDIRLVAYVVAAAASAPLSNEALAHDLRRHLPEYMVPGVWVLLDSLPINLSGKIDRPMLPKPIWAL